MTPPATMAGFESPSLTRPGKDAAYEIKFLLDEPRAQQIAEWARRYLTLDPHGDPALGGAYHTTSLYFDTSALDVYRRNAWHAVRKFRVRRYGSASWVFLERKAKVEDRVRKRRTAVPTAEVRHLVAATVADDWAGRWFRRKLHHHDLRPACRITYQRQAFAGWGPVGPLRLTLDRNLRGVLADDFDLNPVEVGLPLLAGQVVLELKFRRHLPAYLADFLNELGLRAGTISKYRRCREAWGVPTGREVIHV